MLLAPVVSCRSGGEPAAVPATTTTAPAPSTTTPPTTAPPTTVQPTTTSPRRPLEGLAVASGGEVRAIVTPTGVVAPVVAARDDAWEVRTPCGATAVATGTPLYGATVVLDPGHGGDELGAIGPNGLTEKELNLAVARRAGALLEAAGATVVLTRTSDVRMTLATRGELVQRLAPRAFVSIHHNAVPDGPKDGPGTETYAQVGSPEARRLGGLLYEELVDRFVRHAGIAWQGNVDAGAKYRRNSRGDDYYGILRRTAGVPASLTEALFLSNPPEADLLGRPDVQADEAEAIAAGVTRFLTTPDLGSGFTEPVPRSTPAGPGGGRAGCVDPALG